MSKIGRLGAGYPHSLFALAVLLLIGAGQESAPSPTAIVPGKRVGNYLLRKSTLSDILGEDTAAARKRLADQGLHFEFEQGRELKAITVTSNGYQTLRGLKMGSTVQQVEQVMGQPARNELAGDKLKLEAIVYSGVTFFPMEGRVAAIRVSPIGE